MDFFQTRERQLARGDRSNARALTMDAVLEYVTGMNRPLNATNVGDAMGARGVKKGLAQKYLDNLAEGGRLAFKESSGKTTQKVYYPIQDGEVMSAEELKTLNDRTKTTMAEAGVVHDAVKALRAQLQSLKEASSVEDMEKELKALEAENEASQSKLGPLRERSENGDVITESDRVKIEDAFLKAMEYWLSRRKAFNNVFEAVLEGTGGVKKKLWEELGCENEEDVGIDYAKYRKIYDDLKRQRLIEMRQKRFKR